MRRLVVLVLTIALPLSTSFTVPSATADELVPPLCQGTVCENLEQPLRGAAVSGNGFVQELVIPAVVFTALDVGTEPKIRCTFRVTMSANYSKNAGSLVNRQSGTTSATTDCPGKNTLDLSHQITDSGLPVNPTSTFSFTSTEEGVGSVDAEQDVLILEPDTYRAYGNTIRWFARATITPDPDVEIAGRADVCLRASAVYGFDPSVEFSGCEQAQGAGELGR